MKAFKSTEGRAAIVSYYNMLLDNITVPYEKLNIQTRFGDTFILAAGDKAKPPLVLLHGSSMNSAMWIGDVDKLSSYYRVYAPDLPGEPGQSDENQLPFETDDYPDWVSDVLTALSIYRTALAGASLGAWLAAKFSIRRPDQVSKLILMCPAGIGSQNHEFKEIALSLLQKGQKGLDELFLKINGDLPIPEIVMNYQRLIAVSFHPRQENVPIFSDEELKRLTMPSILFVGDKDILLNSLETAERFSKLIPHGQIVRFPDRGHSLSGLADYFLDFLDTPASADRYTFQNPAAIGLYACRSS
jgi:pimeloyl-ACP methyl ester carboxylesterase